MPTTRSRVLWKCANLRHPPWPAQFDSIKGWAGTPGNWCRRCYAERKARMRLHSTDYVRAKVVARGIELRSDYKGIEEKIDCRCVCCGHEWSTLAAHWPPNMPLLPELGWLLAGSVTTNMPLLRICFAQVLFHRKQRRTQILHRTPGGCRGSSWQSRRRNGSYKHQSSLVRDAVLLQGRLA